MRRIGVVVNPIAGMGGRVGLKGTDGKVDEARARGAEPRAPGRAIEALDAHSERSDDVRMLTAGGKMGADEAREVGFDPKVVTDPGDDTSAADTREAVGAFVDRGVDLVLFAGGDGTAVDVANALDDRDSEIPMLGIPAGVKVYSPVFGVTPADAGRIAATSDATADREINDIDEDEYRGGDIETELRAVRPVPVADEMQSSKQLGGGSVEALAEGVAADIDPDVTYVLGPGSTVGAVKDALGFDGSPLGVDVWRDGEVLVSDANETDILDALGEENEIVVSPIGGQGFIFGRGNDQISPAVIRRSDVEVVASRAKLDTTGVLRVDTGDEEVDESLRGWRKVRVGRVERRMMQVR
jgi:NAD+ kinase